MSLFLDGAEPTKIYLGTQSVQAVYLGQTLVWPTTGIEVDSCLADRLIDGAGNIISAVYQDFAARYDQEDVLVWRFGPGYKCYHPEPEVIPELAQPVGIDENGVAGSGDHGIAGPDGGTGGWWGMHGPLAYLPDLPGDPGMAGLVTDATYQPFYPGPEKLEEDHVWDFNARWEHGPNFYNYLPYIFGNNPDISMHPDVGQWQSLSRPVAVASSKNTAHTSSVAVFKNGYVLHTPTAHSSHIIHTIGQPYAALQLPAGKVPTGVSVTLNCEFTLVTVWDTATEQGQLAIIANEGNPPANSTVLPYYIGDNWFWGIPQWPYIRNFKLLGFVDLPMKAPTIVDSVNTKPLWTGRTWQDNYYLDLALDSQTERDWWFYEYGSEWKRVARAGYAVVASRSENKVCFIDMQPLHQYYLTMYFTTQANYNITKNVGPAANQWPHTFAFAPAQTPVVVQTLTIPKPTDVHCGSDVVQGNSFGSVHRTIEDGQIDFRPPGAEATPGGKGFTGYSGDISISELQAQAGTGFKSLRMKTTVDGPDAYAEMFIGGHGTVPIRLAYGFYIETLPTDDGASNGQMFTLLSGPNFDLARCFIDSTGIVRVIDHHNVLHAVSTNQLLPGQWYNLEWLYKPGTLIEFKINGVSEFIASWAPYPGDKMSLNIVSLCSAYGGHITEWFFDNIVYYNYDPLFTEPFGINRRRAYIATQDDGLLVYDIQNLNTEDLTGPKRAPVLETTVDVGNNPSVIFNSHEQPNYGNYFYVLSRGDNVIYELDGHAGIDNVVYGGETVSYSNDAVGYGNGAGFIVSTIRDSRMVDPCYIYGATARQYTGNMYASIHVLDFNGKMVRHYMRWLDCSSGEGFIKVLDYEQWYHGRSNEVPGKPFMLALGEII